MQASEVKILLHIEKSLQRRHKLGEVLIQYEIVVHFENASLFQFTVRHALLKQ